MVDTMSASHLKIEPGSKLLFIGDSITDAGRARPVGEGLFGAHGTGYVNIVAGLLGAVYAGHKIRVVNQGQSGDTVLNLKERWEADVLELKPDWLCVMIGINDVWRQFDLPLATETHVNLAVYEQTLDELITATKPNLKGLVMMSPYYIEPHQTDEMRFKMDGYGLAVKRVAERHGAIYVDVQAAFNKVLQTWYPAALAWDRVHPNQVGCTVIAKAFLDSIGFRWQAD
jgi:lysophospholipase L1-like esterase